MAVLAERLYPLDFSVARRGSRWGLGAFEEHAEGGKARDENGDG